MQPIPVDQFDYIITFRFGNEIKNYCILQAAECHLAGVTPPNKKWSPGSVAVLRELRERTLEIHVEDNRSHGSLGVTLYDRTDEDNVVCVNAEIIKHKFAVSFG